MNEWVSCCYRNHVGSGKGREGVGRRVGRVVGSHCTLTTLFVPAFIEFAYFFMQWYRFHQQRQNAIHTHKTPDVMLQRRCRTYAMHEGKIMSNGENAKVPPAVTKQRHV